MDSPILNTFSLICAAQTYCRQTYSRGSILFECNLELLDLFNLRRYANTDNPFF